MGSWTAETVAAHNARLLEQARRRTAELPPAHTATALLARATAPRNDGKKFEAELAATFATMEAAGVMTVEKVDPPTKVVGSKGQVRVIHLANPFLDFIGAWRGRLVMFEAKSTRNGKLPLDKEEGGLTAKQIRAMRRWRAAGAYVALLWYCEETREAAIATLEEIEHRLKQAKHMKHAEHRRLARAVTRNGQLIYSLAAAEKEIFGENSL